jgi:hypothetical protein
VRDFGGGWDGRPAGDGMSGILEAAIREGEEEARAVYGYAEGEPLWWGEVEPSEARVGDTVASSLCAFRDGMLQFGTVVGESEFRQAAPFGPDGRPRAAEGGIPAWRVALPGGREGSILKADVERAHGWRPTRDVIAARRATREQREQREEAGVA